VTYDPVTSISAEHVTAEFDCGSEAQTAWLRRHALQADRTDSSKVQVVTRTGDKRVVGYYALSAGSVEPAKAPPRVTRGMPRYPVPVVILTRLGVHRAEHGRGLGIHCEDDDAKGFYLHFAEFEESPTDPLQLYLLLSDLRKTFGRPDPE